MKSPGNSDDIADQITGWNDENTLGIPRANLEPQQIEHTYITWS